MAILKIARMGHPMLRQPAEPVEDPTAPEIALIIADMLETMIDAGGVGLAAPQVHVGKRIVAFHVPKARAGAADAKPDSGDGPVGLTILINPHIEPLDEGVEGAMKEGWEACLSVPGLSGLVSRHRRIRYRGVDPQGRPIDRIAEGFHARVVQHECDHLDGILYPQRMTDMRGLAFVDELRRFPPRNVGDGAGPGDSTTAQVER